MGSDPFHRVGLVEKSTREAVMHSELRGKVEVREKGEVPPQSP